MMHPRSVCFYATQILTLALALTVLPSQADEYADVAQLLRSRKPEAALAQAERFLQARPADPQMRFLKGVTQSQLGQPAQAIGTFTKLTEDYPELPEPYNNLAVLYASQGQYDKARVALEMAIRTNPSYATAHENMGDIYSRLASQAYNKALQLDSGNPAVPPKLALIREIFKPNLQGVVSGTLAAGSAPIAAPAPVAAANSTKAATAKPTAAVSAPVAPANSTKATTAKPAVAVSAPAKQPVVAEPDTASAQAAVLAWAKAWSDQDIPAYLAAYSPRFVPPAGQARTPWENDRKLRISSKSSINVVLTDLKVAINGDKASVKFHQSYKADALKVVSRKTLELQKTGEHWLITREATGN